MNPDYEYNEKCHIRFFNCDNMDFMKEIPDNYFDLAIVDPPYNLGKKITGGRFARYGNKQHIWDNEIPSDKYFEQLKTISTNQIIWGGNYFPILWKTACRGFIFWDKNMTVENYSDGELAWTSFDIGAKIAKIEYNGFLGMEANRTHPTQKPIKLYRWLLQKYAKQGDKILDTHGGSMTIARACYEEGFDLDIMELDKEYFDKGVQKFKEHVSQIKLF